MGGMFFEIYQLEQNKACHCRIFQDLPEDQDIVDLSCYVLVSTGHASFDDEDPNAQAVLKELFQSSNMKQPPLCKWREISYSDIVIFNGEAAFYCQGFIWKPIKVINRAEIARGGQASD